MVFAAGSSMLSVPRLPVAIVGGERDGVEVEGVVDAAEEDELDEELELELELELSESESENCSP